MTFRDDLVAKAIEEWTWFGKDEGRDDHFVDAAGKTSTVATSKNKPKETVEPYASRIGDLWLAIPPAEYKKLVKDYAPSLGKLDGTVTKLPWSAATISYLMKTAGAGTSFPYSAGHHAWIVKSIKNREDKKLKAALVGYKPGELELQVGDLIGRSRTKGITYENATSKGWFTSHTDIVVEVDKANKTAYVIGGNVGQTVSKTKVTITKDGKLNDTGGWIVHIQNNIAGPPAGAVGLSVESALAG